MGQIQYKGRLIDADEVEVLSESEKWNEYQLADGRLLRIKIVLISVARAKEEKAYDGMPLYLTKTQQIVKVQ